jgi:hypothetical protein
MHFFRFLRKHFSRALLKAKALAIGMQIAISTENSTTEKNKQKNEQWL